MKKIIRCNQNRYIFFVLLTILLSACGNSTNLENDPNLLNTNAQLLETDQSVSNTNSNISNAESDNEDYSFVETLITYPIVSTGQVKCYDNSNEISCPEMNSVFFGQDGNYEKNSFQYQDNGDGTVSDMVTGLMWQQDPGEKMNYSESLEKIKDFNLAGYTDWRLPTIKELYSLINMSGIDPSGCDSIEQCSGLIPFIDNDYFIIQYGKSSEGDRLIDSQFASSNLYVGENTNNQLMFGVNFADGRIKGYGIGAMPGKTEAKTFYVLYVRGNENYGKNDFVDNYDGTISDLATGLTWQQGDSEIGVNWESSLNYCVDLDLGGYEDWRLPDIKELQSILDYTRSPSYTNSAAIDPIFLIGSILNEKGVIDYPYFWSSTSHVNYRIGGTSASYIAFGEGLGYMRNAWIDIHGAGTQRSDPKIGDAGDYPFGHGPQGDAIRIENYVRCVRN